MNESDRYLMLAIYKKGRRDKLSSDQRKRLQELVRHEIQQRVNAMEDNLFNELENSIQEAGEHLRGERDLPEENIHFVGEPDPHAIRDKMELTQEEFAALLDVSVRTLQNWEQGRRDPRGPARTLLKVADQEPDALRKVAA
jgi:putative transcriptional regulator